MIGAIVRFFSICFKGHVKFHPPRPTKNIAKKVNKKSSIMVDPKLKKSITTMAIEPSSPSLTSSPDGTTALPATPPPHHVVSTWSSATKRTLSADAKCANKKLGSGPWVMARFYGTFVDIVVDLLFQSLRF
jgi:hypothetical protein